jgi:hypothetical protein
MSSQSCVAANGEESSQNGSGGIQPERPSQSLAKGENCSVAHISSQESYPAQSTDLQAKDVFLIQNTLAAILEAQNVGHSRGNPSARNDACPPFSTALQEITAGAKRSHWIWCGTVSSCLFFSSTHAFRFYLFSFCILSIHHHP